MSGRLVRSVRGARNPGGGALDVSMIAINAALAAALGLVLVFLAASSAQVPGPGVPSGGYVTLFSPPRTSFEVLLDHGDGQAYAALAQDPTLSKPEVFAGNAGQAAYFAQRPVLVYLTWSLSLGRAGNVQFALMAVMTLGAALSGGAATALVQALGRQQDARLAILVLVLPGSVVSIYWFGQEGLALAFGLIGLTFWLKERPSPVLAGVFFAVAGLTRETMLVVPVALAAYELVTAPEPFGERVRRIWALGLAPLSYVAWLLVVHLRLGSSAAPRGNLSLPMQGLVTSMANWAMIDGVVALFTLALAVWALVRHRDALLTWLVAAYLGLGLVLGTLVWSTWEGFGRVLLPGSVFAALSLLPRQGAPRPTSAPDRSAV